MTWLLIHDPTAPPATFEGTAFGGHPVASADASFSWPHCRSCDGAMEFLGQIAVPAVDAVTPTLSGTPELALLFQCQNDPGLCDEWDADGGGNKALVVPAQNLHVQAAPEEGQTVRGTRYAARLEWIEGNDYLQDCVAWTKARGMPGREVLGALLGTPSWLQADETPSCDDCKKPMAFLAQLDEGPDHHTAMNFGGGGCAYVHVCRCAGSTKAKLLWQC